MSRLRLSFLVLVGALTLGACASPPGGPALAAAPLPRSFGLRPGDVVRIRVWREPELSGDFIVDEYGKVSLPLLGARVVLGIASDALQRQLETDLASSVKDPSVQVTFLRRIAVQGAARAPGLYPMDATMTVGDAVALAGGRTAEAAAQGPLELWRDSTLVYGQVPTSAFIGQLDTKAGDELRIPKGGWAARNGWTPAGLLQFVTFSTLSIVQIVLITSR
ncbi:MAG: polysaccharide biosynthesis/export family protein [Gemmatimonadetes bacterium]|nr:polysaccharide biosynthesis/export family protein [Gemmatimonadota bacterium]